MTLRRNQPYSSFLHVQPYKMLNKAPALAQRVAYAWDGWGRHRVYALTVNSDDPAGPGRARQKRLRSFKTPAGSPRVQAERASECVGRPLTSDQICRSALASGAPEAASGQYAGLGRASSLSQRIRPGGRRSQPAAAPAGVASRGRAALGGFRSRYPGPETLARSSVTAGVTGVRRLGASGPGGRECALPAHVVGPLSAARRARRLLRKAACCRSSRQGRCI